MIVPEQIKELIPAYFNLMLCQIIFEALVQVSATAPFPNLTLLLYQPNNNFFLNRVHNESL